MVDNETLHRDVVIGIVQFLKFIDGRTGSTNLGVVYDAAMKGICEDAHEWVFEYIKDGFPDEEIFAQVRAGDYSAIWRMTNAYLKRFDYESVEPVEITVE